MEGIILTGMICVLISIASCLTMIIIYIISCLQIKCDILVKDDKTSNNKGRKSGSILENDNLLRETNSEINKKNNVKKK